VFHGSATGIADGGPAGAAARIDANQSKARLGESVAGAGDVNRDGYADVIVLAPGYRADNGREGAVFVLHGGPAGSAIATQRPRRRGSNRIRRTASCSRASRVRATSTAMAMPDVIVGAPNYDAGEGAAFVFRGSANGCRGSQPRRCRAPRIGPGRGRTRRGRRGLRAM
jgi:hypothetical protein